MTESGKCCLCNGTYNHYGNNPFPFFADDEEARCCNICNNAKVIPARIVLDNLAKEDFAGNSKADIPKLFKIFNDAKFYSANMIEAIESIKAK